MVVVYFFNYGMVRLNGDPCTEFFNKKNEYKSMFFIDEMLIRTFEIYDLSV